jgi:hypothetical protein
LPGTGPAADDRYMTAGRKNCAINAVDEGLDRGAVRKDEIIALERGAQSTAHGLNG